MRERGATAELPHRWRILLPRSDARLARLAAAGDPRAFARIYERYDEEIYRFCCALLGDAHEAQDAVQSTMASAIAGLSGEGRRIALRPWLFRVARNECVSILRRRQRPVAPELIEASAAPDAAEDAARRARLGELIRDLRALGERQRAALLMRELSGLGYAEVGDALGISPQAARQAVYEARAALLEMGEGRGMDCEQVQRALSERDGRKLRGRRYRAHLRECARCADFEAGMVRRRDDLAALFPVPPGLGATALAGALTAGKVAGGTAPLGAAGGAASAALGVGSGAKLAATVAAAGALGLGAAGIERAVDRSPAEPQRHAASVPASAEPGSRAHGAAFAPGRERGERGDARRAADREPDRAPAERRRGGESAAHAPPRQNGTGAAPSAAAPRRSSNRGGAPRSAPARGPSRAPGLAVARSTPAATAGEVGAARRSEHAQPPPQAPAASPRSGSPPGKARGRQRQPLAHGPMDRP